MNQERQRSSFLLCHDGPMESEFAKPMRGSVQKTAQCRCCGERLIRRSRKSRFTKLARRHPWFHAETLKEQCEGWPISSLERVVTGMTWLQPLRPVVYDGTEQDWLIS